MNEDVNYTPHSHQVMVHIFTLFKKTPDLCIQSIVPQDIRAVRGTSARVRGYAEISV